MLEFHPLEERQASPHRLAELLRLAKQTLLEQGMASMEEYGDMLKWGLPKKDGACRNLHVFHPDWCSFSDAFFGTVHYHAGWIRGTVLLGEMEHYTYKPTPDPNGDRFLGDHAYSLSKHTSVQPAGTAYELPARVAHWLRPTELTLTYFEEEDNGEMGDLVNPATTQTDEHRWSQAQAEALLPELLAAINTKMKRLTVPV